MNRLSTIKQELASDKVKNRLAMALKLNVDNEKELQEVQSYISSVYYEIEKTAGDAKKDLTTCTTESIAQAMIDAAKFKLHIDGRQHAYLIKYGKKVQMQIGYRGYLYKISEKLDNVSYNVSPVYEGDKVEIRDINGNPEYTIDVADPFKDDWNSLKGIIFSVSYDSGGERKRHVERVSKSDLVKIRNCAKQDFIWNAWPIEKAKGAAAKRACKIIFAGLPEIEDMARYDNEANFEKVVNSDQELFDVIDGSVEPKMIEEIKSEDNSG